jgi:hypothetical protein
MQIGKRLSVQIGCYLPARRWFLAKRCGYLVLRFRESAISWRVY